MEQLRNPTTMPLRSGKMDYVRELYTNAQEQVRAHTDQQRAAALLKVQSRAIRKNANR